MASLKELVEEHGFGIMVKSTDPIYRNHPFVVVSEAPEGKYKVHYCVTDNEGVVSQECPTCNDYVLVEGSDT